ncbi:MAG TPA: carboxypeptidase regulatory-like domain-containing protein [Chitinophagaceae bacterium]
MLIQKIVRLLAVLLVFPFVMQAQVTTSSMSGTVKTSKGEALVGATVTATHVPTGTNYRVTTRSGGTFNIYNMAPGGPYTVIITFVGFEQGKKDDIFLSLGENSTQDFSMAETGTTLTEVIVASRRGTPPAGKGGSETFIGRDKMANIPSVGRNISDFLSFTPQAKITGDGGVSIAGQNNRYNSFYIDGAVNNDVFGIAASGTNGGQANIPPISIDAIDQFQVIISPYDASIGNFTGGGINAITKSGSNDFKGSVWYIYRNQSMAGKSPVAIPKAGSPDVLERTRLTKFSSQNKGFTIGGPIIKNKLFFFLLGETRDDERPQPFNFGEYRGTGSLDSVAKLVNYLKSAYNYDPGEFLNNPEIVKVDYLNAKLDWNINDNNRLTLSHRYNDGERYNTSASSSTSLNFFKNGYIFPTKTNSTSLELKSTFSKGSNNRLLVTLTKVLDDRNPIGDPFPRVTIFDGAGRYVFGTENFSTANLLEQQNISVFDAYKFYKGKHIFTIGTDNEINKSLNVFIRDYFGTYEFASLNAFTSGQKPTRYDRSFSLLDDNTGEGNTQAAAIFKTLKIAFFLNDEIKVNNNLTVNLGIRADRTEFLTKPREDEFLNDTGLAKIAQYYDLKGARSGQIATPKWALSPRVGFTYRLEDENMIIRGGLGMFTGRIPLVWPGGVYNQNGVSIGGVALNPPTASQNIAFRADPFNQYTAEDFGISLANSKGQVDLIASDFRLPKLFRASLAVDKRLGQGWTFTVEGIYSKNINEIEYTNVNILPPIGTTRGPGARSTYGTGFTRIPMRSTGANPYPGNIFLLSNNDGKKGYSYSFTTTIDKAFRNGFAFNANYTYGHSMVLNEGTSSQNNSQWRFMETVNGRNAMELTRSDFDLGHRINAYISKEFTYAKKALATSITFTYNGQSGSPFSYTYRGSPVADDGAGGTNDLIYVPTKQDLADMIADGQLIAFDPASTNAANRPPNGVNYTPAQQAELLDQFIEGDKYLRKRRGQFAERNGARLPFTHIINMSIEQKFRVKLGGRRTEFSVRYDIFNFTNLLNKDWGRTWFLSNDNFSLIQFVSLENTTTRKPRYRYIPVNGTPYGVSTSTEPRLAARWISQLTFRVNF